MANYIGVRCPVCDKKFTQTDDIVVCPVCGAPHHRGCYLEENRCAFEKEHLSGNSWHGEPEDEINEEGCRFCSVCGVKSAKDALFCQVCGASLVCSGNADNDVGVQPGRVKDNPEGNSFGWDYPGIELLRDPLYRVYGGVNPDEKLDGIPVKDLAKYIDSNSAYYLPRFHQIFSGKLLSLNFSALFFGFFYYFYRKMYAVGGLLLTLYLLSVVPAVLYTKEAFPLLFETFFESVGMSAPPVDLDVVERYQSLTNLAQIIYMMIVAFLSLCCNRIYYIQCIKTVERIRPEKAPNSASSDYESELSKSGGTSNQMVIAVGLGIAAMYIISSFIIAYLMLSG